MKRILTVAAFVAASFATAPANAQIPVTDVGAIAALQALEQDVGGRITAVNTSITTMSQRLDTRLSTLTDAVDASSAKTASSVGAAMENANQRTLDTAQEQAKILSEQKTRTPIDPCGNAGKAIASANLDRVQSALRSGGMAPSGMTSIAGKAAGGGVSTGSSKLDKAIQVSENRVAAPSKETQTATAAEGACSAYAAGTTPGTRGGMCKDAKMATSTPKYPNADVRADSLYDGAQTEADTGKITYTFTDEQTTAARAYLRNVYSTVEPRTLTAAELSGDEGKQYLALHDAYMAKIAMAKKPAEEYVNNRSKNMQTIPVLQAMLDGQGAAAAYIKRNLAVQAPKWQSEGISFHELWSLDADRRANNPDWIKEIAAASDDTSLLREQSMMLAESLVIQTRQLIETQKLNMTMGAIYEGQVTATLRPDMMESHAKAVASRGR